MTVVVARRALWSRDFSLYFVARSVALMGDAMLPIAVTLGVLRLYGPVGVGVVLAAWMAAFGGLVLFGGVFADWFTARKMMIGADLLRVVTHLVIAFAFFAGRPALWLLIVMSALSGVGAALFQPGVNSMIPQIADDPQRANAILRVADAVARLVGPGLAGVIVLLGGAGVVYAVNAGTFAISAVCLLALRVRLAPVTGSKLIKDLRAGWREFRSRTWMWSVILVWSVYGITLFGPSWPLGAELVTKSLGESAFVIGVTGEGVGSILGGLIAMRYRPSRPLFSGAVAMIAFMAMPLVIALRLPLPYIVSAMILAGAAWAFWSVMWATSVQTQVPGEVLNRVTAYEVAGSVLSIPIGQSLAPAVGARVGADTVLLFGCATGLLGIVVLLATPAVRNLRAVTKAE
ncbi:MFS transporter [Acrocarpospora pleiomorpha]|uniref:MFS transporter n=1 Tax=Acrocarpospora pleiomorpha TaxID=90975 RepID=A0A5M3Y1J7_9ACTN|nr:MFS transporter [Acrocarpospora pleiomorpha]GES25623.1 MFS transporter [Acrocarpospora pleiomorpha]